MPVAAWLIAAVGAGALLSAYIAEYGFDVAACDLCYWQRVPYGLSFIFGALALWAHRRGGKERPYLALASLSFLAGLGFAVFHTGVEQHWWADLSSCAIQPLADKNVEELSLEDMRKQLLATVGVPCDEITWSFLGLSMANWNILASLAMAFFAALAAFGCCASNGEGGGLCRCCRFCGPKDKGVL